LQDGTLTVPVIDFAYMRQQVGVHSGDILDVISSWPAEEQQKAYAKIAAIEDQALLDMKTMPGLLELCSYLDLQGVARGLITRNVKRSIEYFHSNHFPLPPFIPAISR
jgi:beta-phosphoglucomutase-like phosphatase (HAD superfamily)